MSQPYTARYVLHPDVTEQEFVAFAEGVGATVAGRLDPAKGDPLYEVVLRVATPVHELRFVDDRHVEVSYVVVGSARVGPHHAMIRVLQSEFPMFCLGDLPVLMESEMADLVKGLRRYGKRGIDQMF